MRFEPLALVVLLPAAAPAQDIKQLPVRTQRIIGARLASVSMKSPLAAPSS
jgi:hypothetical protein